MKPHQIPMLVFLVLGLHAQLVYMHNDAKDTIDSVSVRFERDLQHHLIRPGDNPPTLNVDCVAYTTTRYVGSVVANVYNEAKELLGTASCYNDPTSEEHKHVHDYGDHNFDVHEEAHYRAYDCQEFMLPPKMGVYTVTCVAEDPHSTSPVTDTQLYHLVEMPSITFGDDCPIDEPLKEGYGFACTCMFESLYSQYFSLQWTPMGDGHNITGKDNYLILNNQKDTGRDPVSSTCILRANFSDEQVASKALTVEFASPVPSKIHSYTINGNASSRVLVDEGDTIKFECTAEGSPLPDLEIKGLLTGVSLDAEVMQTSVVGVRLSVEIVSASVLQTDIYACSIKNRVIAAKLETRGRKTCEEYEMDSDTEKTTFVVVIGPPAADHPEDNPPQAKSRPDGLLMAEVDVVAHPPPTSYSLVKIRGPQNDPTDTEIVARYAYVVELVAVNCRSSMVKMYTVDFRTDDSRYQFSINNRKGESRNIFLGITKETGDTGSRRLDHKHFNLMIGFGVLLAIGVGAFITMEAYYIYWITHGHGKLVKKRRPSTRKIAQIPSAYRWQTYY